MFADTMKLKTPPRFKKALLASIMASLGSLLAGTPALAAGLGAASTPSRIGGPLRIEVQLLADNPERLDLSCIRLVGAPAGYADETPWLSNGSLSFEQTAHSRVLIIKARPVNSPAIMLGLRVDCGMGLRRDYTLLLNPPAAEESALPVLAAPLVSSPIKDAVSSSKPALGQHWQTLPGDTARSIAEALLPGDRAAQSRFARSILSQNAGKLSTTGTRTPLPEGVEIEIPPLPVPEKAAQQATIRTLSPAAETGTQRSAARTSKSKRTATTGRDRLLLSGGGEESLRMATSIGDRKELGEDQRSRLRTELQLIATLDEKIATQIELSERLRQLEAMQERLKQDAARLEGELQTARGLQSSPEAAALSLRTEQPAPEVRPQEDKAPGWYESNTAILGLLLAAVAGVGAALWFKRKEHSSPLNGDTIAAPRQADPADDIGEHLIDPLSEADIWPDEEGHAPKGTYRQSNPVEGAIGHFTASGLGPASLLQIVDDDVEEHDSAIELAEIMMSFGRVHGAAQTLADFIRANPKQAVKPWIKLLEVYRAADMRVEFDALSGQLNKTFNVRPVEWDNFEIARQTPESLESMPHILLQLNALWGTRECQAYLHGLLRDNRQGTRQGFPLAIVDEILMLLGVMESQIGPYRPNAEDAPTAAHTAGIHTASSAGSLNIPPVVAAATEQATLTLPTQPMPRSPLASSHMALAVASAATPQTSVTTTGLLQQLDFELDMSDLSKTLHLNLDELNEDGNFTKDADTI